MKNTSLTRFTLTDNVKASIISNKDLLLDIMWFLKITEKRTLERKISKNDPDITSFEILNRVSQYMSVPADQLVTPTAN